MSTITQSDRHKIVTVKQELEETTADEQYLKVLKKYGTRPFQGWL